jgi:signal recognition particle subunit SRP19
MLTEHHLYHLISTYLQSHPTTEDSPLRLRLQGLPPPKDGKAPVPAIPRGFKMGSVLPLHSPALSGGGVSENFLKDMMAEMGGQLPEGMQGMANMANMAGGGGGRGGKPKVVRVKK